MLERGRKFAGLWLAVITLACSAQMRAHAEQIPTAGYQYFEIGDLAAERPDDTSAGLMLVGGGHWPYDAFRWFIAKAGHGRIVILRASGTIEAQEEFFNEIGGITAAQTLVFSDRAAASDPEVLRIVREADGIFLAGGDQSKYVNYWQGTPLNDALDEHVRAGKPIGGTSAGLAILGAYSYGALDGRSLTSNEALKNPASTKETLVKNFLHMPYLQNIITDSHFGQRDRLGRLVVFLAQLAKQEQRNDLVGLGIDEQTALCIDSVGHGRVFSANNGVVWRVQASADGWYDVQDEEDSTEVQVLKAGTESRFVFRNSPATKKGAPPQITRRTSPQIESAPLYRYWVGHGELRDDALPAAPQPPIL